ncbi:uncharacterized protein LOC123204028 [Mangifera indica]|uniref:uncharacterized protein LOC123204028 n=1 Tax=Mangifera indica TaxID=29780 RepID=UPI001CFC382C|nr:uncharacterized protein LOC123204028 [Mangifera indica]
MERHSNCCVRPAPGQCCIYKVPKNIRRVNKEAYTPQLISIGPLHHGKQELADMEKKKKQYVKSLIQRTTIEKIDKIPSFIRDKEEQIRVCYVETSTFESTDITPEEEVKHFIDWSRLSLLKGYPRSESAKEEVYDLPCAVKLNESGIKFKVHELKIPQLIVADETELLLINIIALEQCVYPSDALVSNYVDLMDCLINIEEDVDLLVGNQIISNSMGDNASVANMFNKLNQNVPISPWSYYHIRMQLKQHYKNPRNRTKATLKRVYFSNLWRGTATVAAIILLLLTIVQTVCSILQVI